MTRRTLLNLEPLEGRALLSALSVSLTTNKSVYQVGQPVRLTFTETNNTSQPVLVDYGPSNDGFDIEQGGNIVWRSNAGVIPMFLLADTLQPGRSLTLTATWNGNANLGAATASVDTGTFEVFNQLDPGVSATFQVSTSPSPPQPPPSPPPIPTPPSQPIPIVPGPTPPSPISPTDPPSPAPIPPTDPPSPAPIPPTDPTAPAPISPTDPAPIITTPTPTPSTGKHKHAIVDHHNHHQVVRPAHHVPQLAMSVHHRRPGTK
jgi:hypothetical protein